MRNTLKLKIGDAVIGVILFIVTLIVGAAVAKSLDADRLESRAAAQAQF